MKKILLFISFALIIVSGFSQSTTPTNASVFSFTQFLTSRYRTSDSVFVQFQLSTNAVNATIDSITQVSGPSNIPFVLTPSWVTGTTTNEGFWIHGLPPGSYSWIARGKSSNGVTGYSTISFSVVADPVCPICPVCPAPPSPRLVANVQVTLEDGTVLTIPFKSGMMKVNFVDNSVQQ